MIHSGIPIAHFMPPIRVTTPSIFFALNSSTRQSISNMYSPEHRKKPFQVRVSCLSKNSNEAGCLEESPIEEMPSRTEIKRNARRIQNLLDELRRKKDAQREEMNRIEKMILELCSVIDIAVEKGVITIQTADNRKLKLQRRVRNVMIHHGWLVPPWRKKGSTPVDDDTKSGHELDEADQVST